MSGRIRFIRSAGGGGRFLLEPLSSFRGCLLQVAWGRPGWQGIGLQAAFVHGLLPLPFSRAGFGPGELQVAFAVSCGLLPGRREQAPGVIKKAGQPLFPLFVTEAGCQLVECGLIDVKYKEGFEGVTTVQGQLARVEVTDDEELPATRGIRLRCRIV